MATLQASRDPEVETECCDYVLVPGLFWPHNFYFAMTYFAGHARDGPNRGRIVEYQTTERALLNLRGFHLTLAHVSFTLAAIILLVLLPSLDDKRPTVPSGRC